MSTGAADKAQLADRYRAATFELLRWAKATQAATTALKTGKIRVPQSALRDLRDAIALVASLPTDLPIATASQRN